MLSGEGKGGSGSSGVSGVGIVAMHINQLDLAAFHLLREAPAVNWNPLAAQT
jgi:hypothetical protein